MINQRCERTVEILRLVLQNFPACFVSQRLNIYVGGAAEPPEASGPNHDAVLHLLFTGSWQDRRNNRAGFVNRLRSSLVRRSAQAIKVARHPGNRDDNAPPNRIGGTLYEIRGFEERFVQTMVCFFE